MYDEEEDYDPIVISQREMLKYLISIDKRLIALEKEVKELKETKNNGKNT